MYDFDLLPPSITKNEMIKLQLKLKKELKQQSLDHLPKIVSGFDVAYFGDQAIAVLITLEYGTLKTIESNYVISEVPYEYDSGLLAFRELPLFMKVWDLKTFVPDVIFFDGHGINHPNRMGIASHASFLISSPTIGIAKNPFMGSFEEPTNIKGSYEYIYDNKNIIGAVLRTKKNTKPIFVSVGNLITLKESIELTMHLTSSFRIPQIIRLADLKSKEIKRKLKT